MFPLEKVNLWKGLVAYDKVYQTLQVVKRVVFYLDFPSGSVLDDRNPGMKPVGELVGESSAV